MNYEIDCDECGIHKEGTNVKTICCDCFNQVIKENRKLKKEVTEKVDKLKEYLKDCDIPIDLREIDKIFKEKANESSK